MTGPGLTTVLGTDLVVWLAIGLALVGVLGTLIPLVPGALLSLGGVYLYWWSTGYTDPGLLVLVALTLLGLLIVVVDWFAGAVSAKVSGAGNLTTVLAGVAGFLLFFVAGPVGILLGVAGIVFLVELRRTGDGPASARTAVYTTVGMLASTVAQFLLTTLLVLGFLLAILI
ncbi:DUF456 domain-containing protein [Halorientalis pallida]|uniref:DUF456 domain-containing protein n=1 Tax=Halorientalis pallida TaxID=2479928 RepID=A0A498KR35_9EURY|nr:DUF456 domain-containing protein [Halorientalis pallida]RXK46689.1 DUF456 domain-containing protein [Halorientalis pallida]